MNDIFMDFDLEECIKEGGLAQLDVRDIGEVEPALDSDDDPDP